MQQTFLLWALCFSSCLLGAVAQESQSTIFLEASGNVHNGSTVHYDATTAQLELQLKMLIHPMSNKGKSHQQENDYRVELAMINGSRRIMNDKEFLACSLAFSRFAGYCTNRHIFTPIYHHHSHNHTNDVTLQFDHVYSGCYKLKINRCSNGRSGCDLNKGMYEQYLGYLETSIQDVNVRRMNMSISLHPSQGGVEVEFVVNYLENPQEIIKFNQFEVKIKNQWNFAVRKRVVNSNIVNFLNCTEDANCSLPSSQTSECFCLPIGNYTVEIDVLDNRCNHPIQTCVSYRNPCKRYTRTPVFIDLSKNDDPVSMTVTSNVTWIWTNLLLVLLVLVFIAAIIYFKSSCIFYRTLYASSEIQADQQLAPITLHSPIVNTRVLLVYDTNDDSILKKASSLRQQLIRSGVSIVYDAGDPEQQENVIIRGEIHWFNGYINDPEVRIIVIQSTGLNRCHEELNRDRHNGPVQQDFEKLSSLMFVLSELIVLAASIRENGLYGRIFVTSFDDVKCSSPRNLLTPYRCYELPEHFPMMLGQLFVNRSIKIG